MFTSELQAQNCTVNAGVTQIICPNRPLQLHGNSHGLYTGDGNIHWTQKDGPGVTIVDPYDLNTYVTGFFENTVMNFYLWGKCGDGTLVRDSVEVTIRPLSTASAGGNLISCPGTNVLTLSGNEPDASNGETGLWQVVGTNNGVSFTDATLYNTTISLAPGSCGVTVLRWTIFGPNSCTGYADMQVTNRGGVSTVTAGNQTLGGCYSVTQSATLNGSFAGCSAYGQNGHWTLISGPNTPTFSNQNAGNSTLSNLVEGVYQLRWDVTGTCASGTAYSTITVPHALGGVTGASAGGSQVFCDGRTTFTLTGNNALNAGEQVTWSQNGTSPAVATIASPHSPITLVTVPANSVGTYNFNYVIKNTTTNCSSSASTSINYAAPPTISLNGDIALPCGDSIATVTYQTSGGGSVQWSIISGSTNWYYPVIPSPWFDATTSPQLIYHLSMVGTYGVRFRITPGTGAGCTTATADMNITTSQLPQSSNSGTPQLLDCGIYQTHLAGNLANNVGTLVNKGIGHWIQNRWPGYPHLLPTDSPPGYPATVADIYDAGTLISDLHAGLYRFTWIIENGSECPPYASTTRVIVSSAQPDAVDAGPDQNVCFGTPVIMSGTPPALHEWGLWTVSPSGPTFSSASSPYAVVNGMAMNTLYTFTWTLSNRCGSINDVCYVQTTSDQGPIQAAAGTDQCHLNNATSVTLNGNDPGVYTGLWTQLPAPYPYTSPTSNITDASLYNTTVTEMTPGDYWFEWSITSPGCNATRDTVLVTIGDPVTASNAGTDQIVCGTHTLLNANAPNPAHPGETGTWTKTAGDETPSFTDVHSPSTYIGPFTSGYYEFTWTITNGACTNNSDAVVIRVTVPPSAAVGGPDQTLCAQNSTTLAAEAPTSGTGSWNQVSGPNAGVFSNHLAPNSTFSGLITGTYVTRWTVTGGPYCPDTHSDVPIIVYASADAGPDQVLCNATSVELTGNIGSIGTWAYVSGPSIPTITPTSPASNKSTVSGLYTGVYTFSYTVSYIGCSSSDLMTVTISGQPTTANAGPAQTLCKTSTPYSISLAGNAPDPGHGSGLWTREFPTTETSPAGFTDPTNPLTTYHDASSGLHIFKWTITDGTCSNSSEVWINLYDPPSVSNAGPTQEVCGTIAHMNANVPTAGTGNWTQVSGPNTATFTSVVLATTSVTGLIPGTYVFRWTISNGSACATSSSTVTVNVHANPTIPNASTDQRFCQGTTTPITLQLSGNTLTADSYHWYQSSTDINTGVTYNPSATTNNAVATFPGPGVYNLIWMDVNNYAAVSCILRDTVIITIDPNAADPNAGPDFVTCNISSWHLNATPPPDGNGCFYYAAVDIPNPVKLEAQITSLTNTTCHGAANGTATVSVVGGVTPYTYLWNTSPAQTAASATGLAPGAYSVTVSDAHSCTTSVSANIQGPAAALSVTGSKNNISCFGSLDGSINITAAGGTTPYSYAWSNSYNGADPSGLAPGSYTVTITDDNGCSTVQTYALTGPAAATLAAGSIVNSPCGLASGSVVLTGSVPGTVTLNGIAKASPASFTNLRAGAYTATFAATSQGCMAYCSFNIANTNSTLDASVSITQPACNGSTGSATITATGGTPPYTYRWNNSNTTESGSGLAAGNYSVSVSDAASCRNLVVFTITQPAPLTSVISNSTDVTCYSAANGTAFVNASGGTAPYTYNWSSTPAQSTMLATGLIPGTYMVTVTDAQSCTATSMVSITSPAALYVESYSIPPSANGTNDGELYVYSYYGTAPHKYLWSNGTASQFNYNLVAGSYSLTVTDARHCTFISSYVLSEPPASIVTASDITGTLCGESTGSVTLTGNGAGIVTLNGVSKNSPYTYTGLAAGYYTAYFKLTSTGLTGTTHFIINNTNNSVGTVVTTVGPLCNGGSGSITVTATGGTPPLTYILDGSTVSNTGIFSNLAPGSHNIQVTNMVGTWTLDPASSNSGPVTFVSPHSPTTSVLGTTIGSYLFDWTISSGTCPPKSDQVEVTIQLVPGRAIAGPAQQICNSTTAIMAANSPGPAPNIGTWTQLGPESKGGPQTLTFDDPHSPTTTVQHFDAAGTNPPVVYKVIWTISNDGCTTADTIPISKYPDIAINQLADATICSGGTQTLSVTPSGGSGAGTYKFLWESSTTGSSPWAMISGASSSSYLTQPLTSDMYYRVTVECGFLTSTAHITVVPDPSISVQPVGAIICSGGDYTLSVTASGGTPELKYQWYSGSTCGNVAYGIPGATNSSYTISALTASTSYRVNVWSTGNGCSFLYSDCVTVGVPRILSEPSAEAKICNQGSYPMAVVVDAGGSTLSYQWQENNGTTYLPISGETSSTYTPINLANGDYYYKCVIHISPGSCSDLETQEIHLNVATDPVITTGSDQTVCTGGSAVFAIAVSGGTGNFMYQWQSGTSCGGPWTNITFATHTSYSTGAVTSTKYYQCIVTQVGTGCLPQNSGCMTLNVTTDPTVSVTTNDATVCSGHSTYLTATSSGGTGDLTYQWQSGTTCPGGSWTDISGATDYTYGTDNLTQSSYYRVYIVSSGAGCGSGYSNCVTVGVPRIITSPPLNDQVCNGGAYTMSVVADPGGASLTYQWQQNNSGSYQNISGATNTSYTVSGLAPGTYQYLCDIKVPGTSCDELFTIPNTLLYTTDPVISSGITYQTICSGGSATFAVSASGGIGVYTYKWQSGTSCGVPWSDISGATNSSYTSSGLTEGTYYLRAMVNQAGTGCTALPSQCMTLNVIPKPAVLVGVDKSTVCSGGTAILSATASGGTGDFSYQWQSATTSCTGVWSNIFGATDQSYTAANLTQTSFYRMVVSQTGNGCDPPPSTCVIVTVPRITTQPLGANICEASARTLSVVVEPGNQTLTYQWESSGTSGGAYDIITGATDATYYTGALTSGDYYYICVTTASPDCGTLTSNEAHVSVVSYPQVTLGPGDQTICLNGNATFTVSVSGGTGTSTYQWQSATTCSSEPADWHDISGATSATYHTGAFTASGTIYYRNIVTPSVAGCNPTYLQPCVKLDIVSLPVITSQPTALSSVCIGGQQTLVVAITGGTPGTTYQWQSNTVACGALFYNIAGATDATYITPPMSTTTYYKVKIAQSGSNCEAISTCAQVNVVAQPISASPVGGTICAGGTFAMSVSPNGGTGTYTYQWEDSSTNSGFANIDGATSSTYTTVALSADRYYRVTIGQTGEGCGPITTASAKVTVVDIPAIITSPASGNICTGGTFAMSVAASGGTPSLNYQWQYYDGASWNNTGSNSASYTTSALTATTNYQVIVSATGNGCDAVTSSPATVTVYPDPVILVDPVGATICYGGDYTLTVTASGDIVPGNVNYKWQSSPTGLGSWADISGATNMSYNIVGLSQTTYYHVLVSQGLAGCGPATSATAAVIVPSIISQSGNKTLCEGGVYLMQVSVSGGSTTLAYQWQELGTSTYDAIPGATDNTYRTPTLGLGDHYYKCQVSISSPTCSDLYTDPILVHVVGQASVIMAPTYQIKCVGDNASFTVGVTGGAGTTIYQWQSATSCSTFDGDWHSISGATGSSYNTGTLVSSGTVYYRCVVSQSEPGCEPDYNLILCLQLDVAGAVITAQPQPFTACSGGSGTLSVTITGGSSGTTYHWQSTAFGCASAFTDIAGATDASFATPALTTSTWYKVRITEGSCTVTSNCTKATIFADPSITTQPSGGTICFGGNYPMSVAAAGGTPALLYQWQSSSSASGTYADITGATTNTYTATGLTSTTYYHVVVWSTGTDCATVTSNVATVTVVADPVVTTPPASTTICTGGTYTMTISASGGTPSLRYQWENSTSSATGSWTAISGATTATYTTPVLTATNYYHVLVSATGTDCNTATSATAIVTVSPDPTIIVQPANVTICSGGTPTLSVTVTGDPDAGSLAYQWQSGAGTSTYSNITGATGSSYTTTVLTSNTYFRVIITQSASGCTTTSGNALVSITGKPGITIQPASPPAICVGGTTATISVTATGGTPSLSYQWQYDDSGTWVNVADDLPAGSTYSGGTSAGFHVSGISSAGSYQYMCIISATGSGCTSVNTTAITVTVVPDPSIYSQPSGATVCTGGTTAMNISASGGTPGLNYLWENSPSGTTGTWTAISGATTASFTTPALTSTTYYHVLVSATGSDCNTVTSDPATVTVVPDPTILSQPTGVTICKGGNYTLNVTASGDPATGDLIYQWQSGGNTSSYTNITGASDNSYYTGTLTSSTYYRVIITQAYSGCSTTSVDAQVIVVGDPGITVQPVSGAICTGGVYLLGVTATGGTPFLEYHWQSSDSYGGSYANIDGATSATYQTEVLTSTTYYQVVISASGSDCGTATSTIATVTVVEDPTILTGPTSSGPICSGGTVTLAVTATGGTPVLNYQWQFWNGSTWNNVVNGIPTGASYSGSTAATLSVAAISVAGSYTYQCLVSATASGCDTRISDPATFTVGSDPVMTLQPVGATICTGGDHTMTITATGGALTGDLYYQWQSGASTNSYTDISGATNTSYYTGVLTASTYYRCVVTQVPSGCLVNSTDAGVIVVPDPYISPEPSSPLAICVGGTTANVTISASGGTPSLVYEWQYYDGASWNPVSNGTPSGSTYYSGGTDKTFAVSGIDTPGSYQYQCYITSSGVGCGTATSAIIAVTVVADPSILIQPVSPADICSGGTAGMSVSATGGTPFLKYQWQNSTSSLTGPWASITGATNASYTTPALTVTNYYHVQVSATGSDCNTVTSDPITVTVVPDPTLTTPSFTNTSICQGGTTIVSSTISGGTGTPTYQWQYHNGSSWNNVANGTPAGSTYTNTNTPSMTIAGASIPATYQYRLTTNNSLGCDYNSPSASYIVVGDPGITVQPVGQTICTGGTWDMSVTATGGTPALQYQWQESSSLAGTYTDITGATSST